MISLKLIDAPENMLHALTIGKEYEITPLYNNKYFQIKNDIGEEWGLSPENFETPLQLFERKVKESKCKFNVPTPGGTGIRYTVELLLTDKYLVFYSHSRGNHWNMSGNHYYYAHSLNDGSIIHDHEGIGKTIIKQRVSKSDYKRLDNIRMVTFVTNTF